VTVRRAAPADYDAVAEMWRAFDHEVPPPVHEGPADVEEELAEVAEILASEIAFVAEDDGAPVGFALARRRTPTLGTLTDLFVVRDARRSGVGTELMRAVVAAFREEGIEQLDLEVLATNTVARSLYARWGLRDDVVVMAAPVADLEARLGRQEAASFGSIHIQTDDLSAVEQAVRQFVPGCPAARAARSSRRRGTGGPPSTTTSATATRRCCAGSRASSPTGWAPSRCSSASSARSSCA